MSQIIKKTLSLVAILTMSLIMFSGCANKSNKTDCACMRAEGNCSVAEKQQCSHHNHSSESKDKNKSGEQKSGSERKCDDCRHTEGH